MSLYLVIDAFRKLGSPAIKNDDFYDRLSRRYSLIVLGISFLVITTSQFFGNPISCFTFNMAGNHIAYVNWVCWINSTYYAPFNKPLPKLEDPRDWIRYYQWVPFILLSMMFLFYLPGFIWRNLNKSCGINTKAIVKMIVDMDQLDGEKREKTVRSLAKLIDKALIYHREYEHGLLYNIRRRLGCLYCCLLGRHSGNYLALIYIFVKLLYIGNAIGQIFLLSFYMGSWYRLIGVKAITEWNREKGLPTMPRFPRITMCDFSIRHVADNIQTYTVQCLLPINIYNEIIFLFLWFWLCFVACASFYGLIKWLYYFLLSSRINFVERYLLANEIRYCSSSIPSSLSTTGMTSNSDHDDQASIKRIDDFVINYCRQDGLLLLRMIKKNTNNVIAGEIICALWDNWKVTPQVRYNPSLELDQCGKMMGLGLKNTLKQLDIGEANEKLLPPM